MVHCTIIMNVIMINIPVDISVDVPYSIWSSAVLSWSVAGEHSVKERNMYIAIVIVTSSKPFSLSDSSRTITISVS